MHFSLQSIDFYLGQLIRQQYNKIYIVCKNDLRQAAFIEHFMPITWQDSQGIHNTHIESQSKLNKIKKIFNCVSWICRVERMQARY